ncbi:MAG: YkgJ family cysteine cluster protein [Leptospirales bacterium]|jgi:Fe-S-cluster containining protein|nr:YkgJ family cysteine cluster protein [Leptospirales bacterium]
MTEDAAQILAKYKKLLSSIDALCEKITKASGGGITCHIGCSSCCEAGISLFPLEAFGIKEGGSGRPLPEENGRCVFLANGLCSVYSARPIICRTHGYPLLYNDAGNFELSLCEKNFTSVDNIDSSMFIDMEKINSALAYLNLEFVKLFPAYLKKERLSMEEIFSGQ